MRIAIVLNTSWNIYNFRMGLIRHLMNAGHEVVAIAPQDRFTEHIVQAGCKHINLTMDSRGVNPLKDLALTFELYKLYKEIKPDVVLHFTIKPNIYGSLAAKLLGIPVVNNVSGLGTVFLWDNFASLVALWMYKIAFGSAYFVFFQNEDDRGHFIDKVGIKGLRTDVLPGSGINLTKYKVKERTTSGDFTFLLIARLLIDKGIEEFIEAVRILRSEGVKAKFCLLGSVETSHKRGISLDKIEKWISEGLIDYKGTTDNVIPFIQKSDCIVLPSYREGTPRTLLEGASLGKPLIATDVAGCNNVVIDGVNGYLCRVKDSFDLASKMKAMVNLPSSALLAMGKKSRQIVEEKFDERRVFQKYDSVLNELEIKPTPRTINGTNQKSVRRQAAVVNL